MKTAELNGTGVLLHMKSPKDRQIDRQVEPFKAWWASPMDSSGVPALGTTRPDSVRLASAVIDSCCMHVGIAHGTNFHILAVVHVSIFSGSRKPAEDLRQPDWEFGRLRCRKLTCRSQPYTLSLCSFPLFFVHEAGVVLTWACLGLLPNTWGLPPSAEACSVHCSCTFVLSLVEFETCQPAVSFQKLCPSRQCWHNHNAWRSFQEFGSIECHVACIGKRDCHRREWRGTGGFLS